MTRTRFFATHVISCAGPNDPGRFSPGVVDVDGRQVTWVGSAADAPSAPANAVETGLDGVLMPGLVNTHAHTPMTLLRGLGDGLSTADWLEQVIWPREARLDRTDVRAGMTLGVTELLSHGITTSLEMYFAPDVIAEVASEAGLRCVIAPPLVDGGAIPLLGTTDEQFAMAHRCIDRWRDHPLVTVALGPHAPYTVGDDSLERVAALADETGAGVHIHLAEGRDEPPAVERLDRLGLLGPRTLVAHAVWLDEADIATLAERDVAVAHCPVSNARHASGIAPVASFLEAGIRVGLGTDGPVSDPRLDLLDAMREAQRQARLRSLDAAQLPADQALWLATGGAADALGRPDLGRLAPGTRADLIHVHLDVPVADDDDLVAHVVGSCSGADVRDVWVDGTPVVREGACITVDRDAAHADAFSRAVRLR